MFVFYLISSPRGGGGGVNNKEGGGGLIYKCSKGRGLLEEGHERERCYLHILLLWTFCRPVKGICGFSRETVVAVTTNIESIEFRRRQNVEIGYEEHPRAGTTDDVEAFFALLHRYLGLIFTLKEFKALWRKLVRYVATMVL